MVQDTASYAASAVPSSPRGPAVVNAEMPLLNNAAADDLEYDPGFLPNRCLLLIANIIIPITSPPRGRCLLFSQ